MHAHSEACDESAMSSRCASAYVATNLLGLIDVSMRLRRKATLPARPLAHAPTRRHAVYQEFL